MTAPEKTDAAPASAPAGSPAAAATPSPLTESAAAEPPLAEAPAATSADAAPPRPTGPVTLERVRDAWPAVLQRLESNRPSWLLASAAAPVAYADDCVRLLSAAGAQWNGRIDRVMAPEPAPQRLALPTLSA